MQLRLVVCNQGTHESEVEEVVVNTVRLEDDKSSIQSQQHEEQSKTRQAPKNGQRHGRIAAWSYHDLQIRLASILQSRQTWKDRKDDNAGSRRDPVWGTRQLKVPIHLPKSCSPPRVNFNGDQRLVVANLERLQGGSESLRSLLEGFGTWQLNGPHLFESRRGPWARRLDRSIIDRNKTSGGLLWMDSAADPWLNSNEGQRRSSLSTRGP